MNSIRPGYKLDENSISLTNRVKKFGDVNLIHGWMRNRNALEFFGILEKMHNPDFKGGEFETFEKEAGLNSFHLLTAQSAIKVSGGGHGDDHE